MHGMKFVSRLAALLVVLLIMLAWTGCATGPPANVKAVACEGAKIEWEVAPEAEITNFACALGKTGVDPSLIFTVGLKNVASQPLRFRLSILLLDMDKASAYRVPRKGKPPVLAPGKEATVKIPFIKTTSMSKKIMVQVVPLSSD